MRSLLTTAVLAGVFGPLATTAFAADLDYPYEPPPPPPLYAPHPVPPAYIPGPVPPVVVVPRRIAVRPVRVYPRPYFYGAPAPVVRVYGEPRPYAEGYDRPYPPREARPFPGPGPGYERGYERDAETYRHERDDRGAERDAYRHDETRDYHRDETRLYRYEDSSASRHDEERARYGHYLSRDELDRRAAREHGHDDDRYADRGQGRDLDR